MATDYSTDTDPQKVWQGEPLNPDGTPVYGKKPGGLPDPAMKQDPSYLAIPPDTGGPILAGPGLPPFSQSPISAPQGNAEGQWLDFSKGLSGGATFDASTGQTGASAAAGAARGNLGSIVDQYNQKYGAKATVAGGDKIDFGDGRGPVDVIRDSGGGTSGFWYNEGGGGGAGASGVPAPTSTPIGIFAGGPGVPPGQASTLYDMLMKRASQGLDINSNDPIIRNQSDAYNAQLKRGERQRLSALAERVGSNANISAETRAADEGVAQGGASFEAKLMGQELGARRNEIENALTQMQGLLTTEQEMQLREELAQLQLAEGRYEFTAGQAQQESQFGRGLGQRESEFGRNLGQQESEFYRNLAQRAYEQDMQDRYRNSPLGS